MKIRVSDATADLVRVQIDEHVVYVRRRERLSLGNGRPQTPGFDVDGCKVFVEPYPTLTRIIVVKTIPRVRAACAA